MRWQEYVRDQTLKSRSTFLLSRFILSVGQSAPPTQYHDFVSIRTSLFYTCALRKAGEIQCFGQFPGIPSAIIPPLGQFSALALGEHVACALAQSNGTVTCWGDPAILPLLKFDP